MKNNSKYTKNKEKWLDIYKSCKLKLYQFKNKIISIIANNQDKNPILSLNTFKKLTIRGIFNSIKFRKLTILDKYILKTFLLSFSSVVLVLLLVVAGRLFIRLLEYVVEGRFDIDMIFSLLFLSISKSMILLIPFALMIGLILSLSKLYRDGEIYVLKSSGNYRSIFTKLFYIIALPSFLIIFTLNIFASPYLITEIQKKKIEAATSSEIGLKTPGKFIQMKDKNWIIFVEKIEDNVSKRIFIKSSDSSKISIETAEEGDEFVENGIRRLVLKNGQRYTGTPGTGNFQVMKYDEHEVKLTNTKQDFSSNYRMKSISNLIYDDNRAYSNAEIQWRLFAPISAIVLILFAFVLSDIAPRQNKYSNLLLAIIVYFIYSNLAIISVNEIQKNSIIFSFIGTWWVHMLAIIACYLIYLVKKFQIKSYSNLKFFIKNYKR